MTNVRSSFRPAVRCRGFTMLELVVAIAMLALLVGMIFGLATQNLALGNAVVSRQAEVSEQTAFLRLLEKHFSSLPGNARMELVAEDSGAQYLSDLTIQNVPMTFNWGGMDRVAKAVQLSTVRRRDGFLDIVLRYYEEEVLEETEEIGDTARGFGDVEPFAEVVLMEDVYIFEWRVLDPRTLEWDYNWDIAGRLPLQMELFYAKDLIDAETPIRHVFWITPKIDPALLNRQLEQQQRTGGAPAVGTNPNDPADGADGGAGGGGGETPTIRLPNPRQGGGR
jgi:prepilin-type N-terminal cleavage/methylation domain-containing protein